MKVDDAVAKNRHDGATGLASVDILDAFLPVEDYCRKQLGEEFDVASEATLKEYLFQQKKQQKNVYEALENGSLLPGEVQRLMSKFSWQQLADRLAEFQQQRALADSQRKRSNARETLDSKMHSGFASVSKKRGVLVHPPTVLTDEMKRALQSMSCEVVTNVAAADLIISSSAKDVRSLPDVMALSVISRGAILASPVYCLSRFKRGLAVAYKSMLSRRLAVHISKGFISKHPDIAQVLQDMNASIPGSWTFLNELDFFNRVGRVNQTTAAKFYAAFVSPEEEQDPKFIALAAPRFTLARALVHFAQVDTSRCCDNLCGH